MVVDSNAPVNEFCMGDQLQKKDTFISRNNAPKMMTKPTKETFCPECSKEGLTKRLKLFQIGLEDAVYLCENDACLYPLTCTTDQLLTSRKAEVVGVSKKHTTSKKLRTTREDKGDLQYNLVPSDTGPERSLIETPIEWASFYDFTCDQQTNTQSQVCATDWLNLSTATNTDSNCRIQDSDDVYKAIDDDFSLLFTGDSAPLSECDNVELSNLVTMLDNLCNESNTDDVITRKESETTDDVFVRKESETNDDIVIRKEPETTVNIITRKESEIADDALIRNEPETTNDIVVRNELETTVNVITRKESDTTVDIVTRNESATIDNTIITKQPEIINHIEKKGPAIHNSFILGTPESSGSENNIKLVSCSTTSPLQEEKNLNPDGLSCKVNEMPISPEKLSGVQKPECLNSVDAKVCKPQRVLASTNPNKCKDPSKTIFIKVNQKFLDEIKDLMVKQESGSYTAINSHLIEVLQSGASETSETSRKRTNKSTSRSCKNTTVNQRETLPVVASAPRTQCNGSSQLSLDNSSSTLCATKPKSLLSLATVIQRNSCQRHVTKNCNTIPVSAAPRSRQSNPRSRKRKNSYQSDVPQSDSHRLHKIPRSSDICSENFSNVRSRVSHWLEKKSSLKQFPGYGVSNKPKSNSDYVSDDSGIQSPSSSKSEFSV